MDFQDAIIRSLGIQDVEITDIKLFQKDMRAEVHCRQRRDEKSCCHRCRSKLGNLHDWYTKTISGPAWGVYQQVTLKVKCFRAKCEVFKEYFGLLPVGPSQTPLHDMRICRDRRSTYGRDDLSGDRKVVRQIRHADDAP